MRLGKISYRLGKKLLRPLGLDMWLEEKAIEFTYRRDTARIPEGPSVIWIEPTNSCNLNCIMCDREAILRRGKGFMSLELFIKIIDQAAEQKVEKVNLQMGGEPLLHPNLLEMIRYAKGKTLVTTFNTNANLLDEGKSRAIIEAGLDLIIFSVEGASNNIYGKIRRGGNYEIVQNNIHCFLNLKKELGVTKPETRIETLIMKGTENEIKKIVEYWQPYVNKVMVSSVCEYGGVRGLSLLEKNMKSKKILCPSLWRSLAVLWNGDVTVCCGDLAGDLVIGNIMKSDIRSLWNSTKLNEMRRIHRKREFEKIPRCNDCEDIYLDLIRRKEAFISQVLEKC